MSGIGFLILGVASSVIGIALILCGLAAMAKQGKFDPGPIPSDPEPSEHSENVRRLWEDRHG